MSKDEKSVVYFALKLSFAAGAAHQKGWGMGDGGWGMGWGDATQRGAKCIYDFAIHFSPNESCSRCGWQSGKQVGWTWIVGSVGKTSTIHLFLLHLLF